ncbi:oxidoreductase [Streptomyces sp. NPDC049627]|uniref:oxidoreductase n=1 Tax=Streptomyces sp. NPDC049627 TaxID=3365595 RepID=UPI0037B37DF0
MSEQTITAVPGTTAGTWRLGDREVGRLGFGAMRLTQQGEALVPDAVPSDRARAIGVLRRAVDLGVNHIDTAAFYFSSLRSANELINSALSPYPDDLVIATKVGPGRDPSGRWLPHATPAQLRGQVEENLRQLGRDHLDVVNLRIVGTDSIAERFAALADLRTAGLIRHLGLSNVTPSHLAEAQRIAPVVCVQNPYGIGVRPDQDEFLRTCGDLGIAYVPFYAVAGSSGTAGALGTDSATVRRIARAHGVGPVQIRIAWTLHQGPHVLAIPGTGDPQHLTENMAAGAVRLSADDLAALDAEHRGEG